MLRVLCSPTPAAFQDRRAVKRMLHADTLGRTMITQNLYQVLYTERRGSVFYTDLRDDTKLSQTTPSPRLPLARAHLRRYPRELVRPPQMPHRDVRELVGQHRPLLVRHPLAPLRGLHERTLDRLGTGSRLGVAPHAPARLIARVPRCLSSTRLPRAARPPEAAISDAWARSWPAFLHDWHRVARADCVTLVLGAVCNPHAWRNAW